MSHAGGEWKRVRLGWRFSYDVWCGSSCGHWLKSTKSVRRRELSSHQTGTRSGHRAAGNVPCSPDPWSHRRVSPLKLPMSNLLRCLPWVLTARRNRLSLPFNVYTRLDAFRCQEREKNSLVLFSFLVLCTKHTHFRNASPTPIRALSKTPREYSSDTQHAQARQERK